MNAIHVCKFSTGPFVINDGGWTYRFEDSVQFGPWLVDKRDRITNKQPAEHSPFWRLHRIWVTQGRRTGPDGIICVWDEPKPMLVRRINKRNVLLVENGDEDGRMVEVD